MVRARLSPLLAVFCLSGCLYHVQQHTEQAIAEISAHPHDLAPPGPSPQAALPPSPESTALAGTAAADVRTASLLEPTKGELDAIKARLAIPDAVPGSEAPLITLPREEEAKQATIRQLYPDLGPLPPLPPVCPGPDGRAYTLADFQRIAAENSPTLRQAAADVEAARGNLIQAAAYPNPTVGYVAAPSSDGSTPGSQGALVSQTIKTGGKLKLQAAIAQVALDNAELALKRARSDLATAVRNAYFGVLIGRETVRVNHALAEFTDEVYRVQTDLLKGGFAGPYEPAALRAQAYTTRLALKQAMATYLYNWKSLVAVIGLRQLPLSEVGGRIDTVIPAYDYDAVLAHVLAHHTDVLTARNAPVAARYSLQLAQVLPFVPDVSVQAQLQKDFAAPPFGISPSVQVTVPVPLFDQNKGNIIAAEAAFARASEESRRVETVLTNNLANAYTNYRNALDGLEMYRKFILPDQVRFYRGVFARRGIDANVQFADLVTAQQGLASAVSNYLTVLNQLWVGVVGVADFLQTDDLFQCSHPLTVPPLPDLTVPPAGLACPPNASAAPEGPETVSPMAAKRKD